MYFSFWPTFCAIYRLQARKFMQGPPQSLGARTRDAVVSAVSADQRLCAAHISDALRTAHAAAVEHAPTRLDMNHKTLAARSNAAPRRNADRSKGYSA